MPLSDGFLRDNNVVCPGKEWGKNKSRTALIWEQVLTFTDGALVYVDTDTEDLRPPIGLQNANTPQSGISKGEGRG